MRRTHPLLIVGLLTAVVSVALVGAAVLARRAPPPPDSIGEYPLPSTPAPLPDVLTAAFDGPVTAPVSNSAAPTDKESQSKLWYRDDGWWGVLLDAEGSALHIYRLDETTATWVDTAVLVDQRRGAHVDVLSDGDSVYVAASVPGDTTEDGVTIRRYDWDAASGRYVLAPDFPVHLPSGGSESVTITKDTTGMLWVAYIDLNQVFVSHSVGSDAVWAPPYQLPVDGTLAFSDDIAAVVAFGPGRIGVMWSNQADEAFYFAVHEDGAGDDAWTGSTALAGRLAADDHISLRAVPEGHGLEVIALVKTSYNDAEPPNYDDALSLMLALHDDGTWTRHLVSRVRDQQTRPMLVIDADAREAYVFTGPPLGGAISFKRSSLDDLSFPPGEGSPFVTSDSLTILSRPTSTKQWVTRKSRLVVVAWDTEHHGYTTGVLWQANAARPSPSPAASAPPGASASPSTPAPSGADQRLFLDTFDHQAAGSAVPSWSARDTDPAGSLALVADPVGEGVSARVTSSRPDDRVRACRTNVTPTSGSRFTIASRALVTGPLPADAAIAMLRGGGTEILSVKFGQRDTLVYQASGQRVNSGVPFARGTWYRSLLTVDLAAGTYDWQVRRPDGRLLLNLSAVPLVPPQAPVETVCVQVPTGPGTALYFDDVEWRGP